MNGAETVSHLALAGAVGFGAIVGWYLYYINRHRTDQVKLQDLITIVGALGGAAILAIFPARTALFGAYGVGLAGGFFGYFFSLLIMVGMSKKFGVEWFLDGRRKKLDDDEYIPEGSVPMMLSRSAERTAVNTVPSSGDQAERPVQDGSFPDADKST